MLPVLIAVFAILFAGILVQRYRLQEERRERRLLKRIADNYLEPHSGFSLGVAWSGDGVTI
jgi:hypothetical protein